MRVSSDAPEITPYEAVPPHYVKTVTEYLRAAGYYCTNNSKTDYQFACPITAFDENGSDAHWRHRADGQPFFSIVTIGGTHESSTWDEDEPVSTDPEAVPLPPYLPDTTRVRTELARYYDAIARVDAETGTILRDLEDDGLAEDTVVFILSDHGEGFPRAKRWVYDRGVRVPLIVRWPGVVDAGTTSTDLVSWVDLAPTVLAMCGVEIPTHMQGTPFLPDASDREYVFAARDRHGGDYDMVRSVRDERFTYIRNYYPNQPYLVPIPYRSNNPTMQELLRLERAGELAEPAAALFRAPRPVEELYDRETDPDEIDNLAGDPASANVLTTLRTALDDWQTETDDLGDRSERDVVAERWPDGTQPTTATPDLYPNAATNPQREAIAGAHAYDGPVTVSIRCRTQGASIAYTTDAGDEPHWRLYTEPIRLAAGQTTLRARAIQYGYAESDERRATIDVQLNTGRESDGRSP